MGRPTGRSRSRTPRACACGVTGSRRTSRPSKDELQQAIARGDVDVEKLYEDQTITRFEQFVPERERPNDEDEKLLAALQESVAEARAKNVA